MGVWLTRGQTVHRHAVPAGHPHAAAIPRTGHAQARCLGVGRPPLGLLECLRQPRVWRAAADAPDATRAGRPSRGLRGRLRGSSVLCDAADECVANATGRLRAGCQAVCSPAGWHSIPGPGLPGRSELRSGDQYLNMSF